MIIYNADGLILGRLASAVAKQALLGEEVVVVNCEKAVISGRKKNVLAVELAKRKLKGYPFKSPKYSRLADRMVRRMIRGMIPWKSAHGKDAFKRIMCHVSVPAEFNGKEMLTLKKASFKKLPNLNYITVGEVCRLIGGKASDKTGDKK